MTAEQFDILERKVGALLDAFLGLKKENARLVKENHDLLEERDKVRSRLDAVLAKLEGI